MRIFDGPLKLCLRNFAEKSLHCSIILRGKEQSLCDFAGQRTKALWFCGAKSALLHNFARQSLHGSIILRGKDMNFGAKKTGTNEIFLFLTKIFYYVTVISKIYSTMVTTFLQKNKLQDGTFNKIVSMINSPRAEWNIPS